MSIIFKHMYELLSSPLGLPIDCCQEYIVLMLVNYIAYRVAFNAVGTMYRLDMIDGKTGGSFFHYLIRIAFFVIIWGILYIVIAITKLILGY